MAKLSVHTNLSFGACVIIAVMEFMYMIAGWSGYTFYDGVPNASSELDDMKNAFALLGTVGLFMLISVTLELVLGFMNMDQNKMWSGVFIFMSFLCCVFTIAAASLAAKNGDSDIKTSNFFLFAAPITFRGLVGYLKFKDMRAGGDAPAE